MYNVLSTSKKDETPITIANLRIKIPRDKDEDVKLEDLFHTSIS